MKNKFAGVIALENIFPSRARHGLGMIFDIGILVFLMPITYTAILKFEGSAALQEYAFAFPSSNFWLGLLYIFASCRLLILALDSFFNSKTSDVNGYLAALDFLQNPAWHKFVARLGIEESSLSEIAPENPGGGSFTDIAASIFEKTNLKNAIIDRNIKISSVQKAAYWAEREVAGEMFSRRWWRREHLARLQGLGKNFAYGETYFLEKFAYDLAPQAEALKEEIIGKDREMELIEKALLKSAGANILIVGDAGVGKHTLLLGLTRAIYEGKIFPSLEYKQVFKLYAESIIASGKTKGDAEAIIIKLLNETAHAGNIILAIDNFPEFVESLSNTGINALELLSPYLANPSLHIIALADKTSARKILESNQAFMKFFERIDLEEPSPEYVIEILENEAVAIEKSLMGKVMISYPALEKTAEVAAQNLVLGAMPKRAVELLKDVFSEGISRRQKIIPPEIVLDIVSRKTKMPLGEISEGEKEKLLNLEDILSERVVGQTEATNAVANAVRRARAGIESRAKPLASFLFLGPTGVGKTETAKALAFIYFEGEESMLRFDMSEYQAEDSMDRLIGSFEKNEPGLLASKISAQPYAVVLLDEFEKSNPKVRNLFLQVLDEGFFTDFQGKKINMRNVIIVATSNAGSDLEQIQREKIFSLELLNRFDSVVIFRPLGMEVLNKIAKISLNKLKQRLERENYILKINDALADAVAKGGYNPAMGARPMQRFIQDKIEKIISEKIIKGEIKNGREFEISPQELANL